MDTNSVKNVNHRQDALTTPDKKLRDAPAGKTARKAPSIMVPSIIAWGLNQVTTQAVEMVLGIDTIDLETWSNKDGDGRWKAERHEAWIRYITDEVVPFLRNLANEKNGWEGYPGIITFGCSLGATHAANLYLRRPDLFDGTLALSGIYTSEYGFGSYMDDIVYQNSPVHYMRNLPTDHPYIDMFNQQKAVICVGQGDWEIPDTTKELKAIFAEKGINIWVDLWGYDVKHDWDWWYKQVVYFLPYILER